ncbi:putative ABC transporter [Cladorrhinum samala]|uniref:ABC transporter n=1 Tax=Cladorrhinum samala TaxID=585594 RepID=A0AAV9HPP4_9PEZI|nr:putative ABC transporter [Cladorrhinum samala]
MEGIVEKDDAASPPARGEWKLKHKVAATRDRDDRSGLPSRELGVTWKDLTVQAVSADAAIHDNVFSQFNFPKLFSESRRKPPLKTIVDKTHGCVKPGEMLLVLGRPGSGCTTLLNILANNRKGYRSVTGDVRYGSMDASEAAKYRGQIIMNTEEEIFFPSLTVGQTMDFATRLNIPAKLPDGVATGEEYRQEVMDFLLESMGITHTRGTKVGNEYVRGVSGGERKRVSIIECLATRGSVFCWDNSTRGLDASSALDYCKALRAMTDVLGLATIVTLYQAGNGIYDQFDKVLVLDAGREVYYGPMEQARPFMESLGFVCAGGSNVADYLTGVSVPTERIIAPGHESTFPRTPDALRQQYERSPIFAQATAEYGYPESSEARDRTKRFQELVATERSSHLPKHSPFTVSFAQQVVACIKRQYQIIWGDKATLAIKMGSTLAQALITGSLFYNAPADSSGLFLKGGALFFALLHNCLMSLSEVTESFHGRPVLAKHKQFAYFHPAAFCIAQVASDIPVVMLQVSIFAIVQYFMVGLKMAADAWWTYWIVVIASTMCMTALFRMVGAAFPNFDSASKIAGILITILVTYTGYMIVRPKMHPWFGWIFWVDPLAYAFDALLSNEFRGTTIPCVGPNLVPSGPGYDGSSPQSCAGVSGATQGQSFLPGDDYLKALHYSSGHIWRNFGIIWAMWLFNVSVTIFFTMRWRPASETGPTLLIPREYAKKTLGAGGLGRDEEAQFDEKNAAGGTGSESDETVAGKSDTDAKGQQDGGGGGTDLIRNTSVFTWKNLCYTVNTPDGPRRLLDNVQGWVKPGMLGALMGSSGAGKTTLLDVLAQRKTEGTINGSIMVDGRDLPVSFQRSAGYCEQLDVHEPYATVREALEFSALLRQPRGVPRAEKLKYVDTIIDLLELHDLADTLIGKVGSGLSVEQRKRVTIGVELVAKPSILIFLDEPTSGLDGQSAFNTVRFLRKLADVGQAILVTIHQPSAQLFAQFDTLLLLQRGGKTVYFGDIGECGNTIKDYFGRYGAPCPENANPAEHMIDVVTGHHSEGRDWNQVWLESPEHAAVVRELDSMIAEAAAKPAGYVDDGQEFAMPLWEQCKIVTNRMNVAIFRNCDYVNNKVMLHVGGALFNGFSFWMIGDAVSDMQMVLFSIFQFVFVAPGVIAQLQPLFIDRRDIFEAREKKSKMYSWIAFVTGLIVSEIPYLMFCGVLYYCCWYYTLGLPKNSNRAGATLFTMLMYEFIYTGMGQFIAAYAPNDVFASLANPLFIGTLISFCGAMVPYAQINVFWRYWIYYLNPFTYMMGAMLTFSTWGREITCRENEFAVFDPPNGTTCSQYLDTYLGGAGSGANLINPLATERCKVCQYRTGSDYLRTINITSYTNGWRDAAIVVIFVLSGYATVYALMKLRTKTSKKAE